MFNPSQFGTFEEIEVFLKLADNLVLDYSLTCLKQERGRWIRDRLVRFKYRRLRKVERGIFRRFLGAVTGYSPAQLSRHIDAYRCGEPLEERQARHRFPSTYTPEDRELLAEVDNATGRLSGNLAAQFCADQFIAGDERFIRLKEVSSATIYRIRGSKRYQVYALTVEKTKPTKIPIGERRKPEPNGIPGFLRVDTVHQGDLDKTKGVYHINFVDEVTQWEVVIAVEQIAESILEEVLKVALLLFPFCIRNFHSDNGGEYINKTVAALLNKLLIRQTKGRPRHSNDNGLVETKNGAIIRKEMGYWHIPGVFASRINVFYRDHLVPFLNYYRPCHFPERTVRKNGKVIVRYLRKDCMTPYRKLQSLPNWQQYLRSGITPATLQQQVTAKTPLQAAQEKNEAKRNLFSVILPKLSATLPSSLTH